MPALGSLSVASRPVHAARSAGHGSGPWMQVGCTVYPNQLSLTSLYPLQRVHHPEKRVLSCEDEAIDGIQCVTGVRK